MEVRGRTHLAIMQLNRAWQAQENGACMMKCMLWMR